MHCLIHFAFIQPAPPVRFFHSLGAKGDDAAVISRTVLTRFIGVTLCERLHVLFDKIQELGTLRMIGLQVEHHPPLLDGVGVGF
jgi:hypothetical protein